MDIFDLNKEFQNAGNKDELAIKIAQLQEEMKQEHIEASQSIEEKVNAETALFDTVSHEERVAIKEEIASGKYNLYPIEEQEKTQVLEQEEVISESNALAKLEELRKRSREMASDNQSKPSISLGNIKEKSKGIFGKMGFKK